MCLSGTGGEHTLLDGGDAELHAQTHTCGPVRIHPLHLLATQKPLPPTMSGPSPFIPFSKACTTTKAEKLGSCVDDRATNLFGGTHYIKSLYSWAAERPEINVDMQRWASL